MKNHSDKRTSKLESVELERLRRDAVSAQAEEVLRLDDADVESRFDHGLHGLREEQLVDEADILSLAPSAPPAPTTFFLGEDLAPTLRPPRLRSLPERASIARIEPWSASFVVPPIPRRSLRPEPAPIVTPPPRAPTRFVPKAALFVAVSAATAIVTSWVVSVVLHAHP